MAKKKTKASTDATIENLNVRIRHAHVRGHSRRMHMSDLPEFKGLKPKATRKATRLGELLRKGLVDGVTSSSSILLRGQYDEAFDIENEDGSKSMYFDPASDIHSNKFVEATKQMKAAAKTASSTDLK